MASFAPEPKIAGTAGTNLNRFETGTFNESMQLAAFYKTDDPKEL